MNLLPFLIAFFVSLALTPLVRYLSARYGQLVDPRSERWHKKPTPSSGGIAFFLAFLAPALLFSDGSSSTQGLILGAGIAFALGLIDDVRPVSPPIKLLGLFTAASVIVFSGNSTAFFPSEIANIIVSLFWLVAIANAINLLDNMDGLASGTVLVGAGFLVYFFAQGGNTDLLPLALGVGGAVLGFMIYNFPPASIFMGDSGSLFLGILLAGLAISREPQASNVFAILGVPVLILLLPILDTAMVSITRLLRGQSPAIGGKDHLSHRLVSLGFSERQVLIMLMGTSILSGVAAIALESFSYSLSIFLLPIAVLIFALIAAFLGQLKIEKSSPRKNILWKPTSILGIISRWHVFEIVLDFFLVAFSYYAAFAIKFGLPLSQSNTRLFQSSLPIILTIAVLALVISKIYKSLWKYLSIRDLIKIVQASILASVGAAFVLVLVYRFEDYSRQVFILYPAILFVLVSLARFSFRVLDSVFGKTRMGSGVPVLIYGAGDAGEFAIREMLRNKELNFRPVGFIDDNPQIRGRDIHGITVLGAMDEIEAYINKSGAQGLIISSRKIDRERVNSLLQSIQKTAGFWVKELKIEFDDLY